MNNDFVCSHSQDSPDFSLEFDLSTFIIAFQYSKSPEQSEKCPSSSNKHYHCSKISFSTDLKSK